MFISFFQIVYLTRNLIGRADFCWVTEDGIHSFRVVYNNKVPAKDKCILGYIYTFISGGIQ